MKRTPLIFAALTPFIAVAGGGDKDKMSKVDHEQLRDDWRVSEIIGSDVRSSDGQEVGEINDVILTDDGEIASILVDASELQQQSTVSATGADNAEGRQAEQTQEDELYTERGESATAGTEATENQNEGMFGLGDGGQNIVAVQWQNPSFNADDNTVELSVSADELQRMAAAGTAVGATSVDMQRRDGQTDIYGSDRSVAAGNARTGTTEVDATGTGDVQSGTAATETRTVSAEPGLDAGAQTNPAAQGNIRASELIGMEVHLADEESYGEVEDVLVSRDGKASAYVVDGGNFFQTEQYALPANAEVDQQQESVSYEMTSEELENMEEFDLDEHVQGT